MKATKLMALGLVGLTTLGLASTAKAEDTAKEKDSVNTQASVTFSLGATSGDQNGPDGKPVAPDNPIVETPDGVNGWKLSVPSKLIFTGSGSTLQEENSYKRTIYNPNSTKNTYVAEKIKYADGNETPFFLRFDEMSEDTKTGTFKVSVQRDEFKLNGVTLDVDKTSYIEFPVADKYAYLDEKGNAHIKPTPIEEWNGQLAKLSTAKTNSDVGTVKLLGPEDSEISQGFVTFNHEETLLHIGTRSKMLANVDSATVTTVLTWTFAAETTNQQN